MSSPSQSGLESDLSGIQAWRKTAGDYETTGYSAAFFLDAEHLRPAVKLLFDKGYFLEDIAGVDVEEGIMLVYHFDRYDAARRVALRLIVPHGLKRAPSISAIFTGAEWHERECFDFFGVEFEGHPALKPLLLPDDMEIHPLVKEKGRKSLHGLLPLSQMVDGNA